METLKANKLLLELVQQKAQLQPGAIKDQLTKLFVPALRGENAHVKKSLTGRIVSILKIFRSEDKKAQQLMALFKEALAAAGPQTDAALIQLAQELEGDKIDSESPLAKLTNPNLETLEGVGALKLVDRVENTENFSAVGKRSLGTVDRNLFRQLFGMRASTLEARKYWNKFLDHLPIFKHKDYIQLQRLSSAARNRSQKLRDQLFPRVTSPTNEQREAILTQGSKDMAARVTGLSDGEAIMYTGHVGPKANSIKTFYRFMHSLPPAITQAIPEMVKSAALFENPKEFIRQEVLRKLQPNLKSSAASYIAPLEKLQTKLTLLANPSNAALTTAIENAQQRLNLILQNCRNGSTENLKANLTELAGTLSLREVSGIRQSILELAKESSLEQLQKNLSPFAEDPMNSGILSTIDNLLTNMPCTELLHLLRLITYTPGIESHMVTTIFYYSMGLMQIMPHDKALDYLRWARDNATRLANKETCDEALEEMEKFLVGQLVDKPIDDLQRIVEDYLEPTIQMINKLPAPLVQVGFETLGLDASLQAAPYWLKIVKQPENGYSVYIYAAGHALTQFKTKDGYIQWPMRISNVPADRLNEGFFKRLLTHQFRPEYDIDFQSRSEDLFGENGTFATLKTGKRAVNGLEWRPFHRIFDSEWELLIHTTTSLDATQASLMMHVQALADFTNPYRKNGRLDFKGDLELCTLIENGIKLIQRELRDAGEDFQSGRKVVEATVYEVREAIQKCRQSTPVADDSLIPPTLIRWMKSIMQSKRITSEQILGFRFTLTTLFGKDSMEAIELLLKSIDAIPSKTIKKVIEETQSTLEQKIDQLTDNRKVEAREQLVAFKQSQTDRSTFVLFNKVAEIIDNLKTNITRLHKAIDFDITTAITALPEDSADRKKLEATKQHLSSLISLLEQDNPPRMKELELARIILLKPPHVNESILNNVNSLWKLTNELHLAYDLKEKSQLLRKYIQLDSVSEASNNLFAQMGKRFENDDNITLNLNETARVFSVLNNADVSHKELKQSLKQLKLFEQLLKTRGIALERFPEIAALRAKVDERMNIENSFAASKGSVKDILSNVYTQTIFHLIEVILAIPHWMSPIAFQFLYRAFIGILPTPVGNFIDMQCKALAREVIKFVFIAFMQGLARQRIIEPATLAQFDNIGAWQDLIGNIATSFTGKRRVNFKIAKSSFSNNDENIDLKVKPLLLPFLRFCSLDKITYTTRTLPKNEASINTLTFQPYALTFTVVERDGNLKAVSTNFGNYAIAENQEDPQFKRYGSYLLLENREGKKKIIIPSGVEAQSLTSRLVAMLGPLGGLLGNLMNFPQQNIRLPHRGETNSYHTYEVDEKGFLKSEDPIALAYLTTLEVLHGRTENANHAADHLLHILNSSRLIANLKDLEMMLWPLAITPGLMERVATIDELGNTFRIRHKLFAAIQKRIGSTPLDPTVNTYCSALIAQSLYFDLYARSEIKDHERGVNTLERDEEDWLLYNALERHSQSLKNPLKQQVSTIDIPQLTWTANQVEQILTELIMTPAMGRRQRELDQKFGGQSFKKYSAHLLRDIALNPNPMPPRCPILFSDASATTNLANATLIEDHEETEQGYLMQMAQSLRTGITVFHAEKIDTSLLASKVASNIVPNLKLKASDFTETKFLSHFVTYYGIAHGDEGDERRHQLLQLLQGSKGGWSYTSGLLIDCLIDLANPPVDIKFAPNFLSKKGNLAHKYYAEKLYPTTSKVSSIFARGNQTETKKFIQDVYFASRLATLTRIATRPLADFGKWLIKGPILSMFGGRQALFPWIGLPLERLANVVFDNLKATPNAIPPIEDRSNLSLAEEDSRVDQILATLTAETFNDRGLKPNASLLTLYCKINGHKNALKRSLESDKAKLMIFVNPPNKVWPTYRKPITYQELLNSFFKGDLRAIGAELELDDAALNALEQTILCLTARETRLNQLNGILQQIISTSRIDPTRHERLYHLGVEAIRTLMKRRRCYKGENVQNNKQTRLYLCWEIGHKELLYSLTFPRVKRKIQNSNEVNNYLHQAAYAY